MRSLRFAVVALAVGCTDIDIAIPDEGTFANTSSACALAPSGSRLYLLSNAQQGAVVEARTPAGAVIWRTPISGTVGCGLALDDAGNIYGTALEGLYSLDSTGSIRWQGKGLVAPFQFASIAIGSNQRLFAHIRRYNDSAPRVFAVDGKTGGVLWTTVTNQSLGQGVVDEARSVIYYAGFSGAVAFDIQLGNIIWNTSPPERPGSVAAIGKDGTLYVGNSGDFSRSLASIAPDGNRRWSRGIAESPGGIGPLIDDAGNIIASGGGASSFPATITSLTSANTVNWSYTGFQRIESQGVIASDGTLYFLGRENGDTATMLIGFRNPTVVLKKSVARPQGGLGLSTLNGFDDRGVIISTDGRLYYRNSDGDIAYLKTSGYNNAAEWPLPAHDYRNTSRK